jgi:hypothetical protein
MKTFRSQILNKVSEETIECFVELSDLDRSKMIRVCVNDMTLARVEGYDFEEALANLGGLLERSNQVMLCNRFRRNALVTSLSRQMSGGLGCYLVLPRQHLNPDRIVHCLAPAPAEEVVFLHEAESYLADWKELFEKPLLYRVLSRLSGALRARKRPW